MNISNKLTEMIDYKCILFKEPVTMGPKPDLKISGYGLLYSVQSYIYFQMQKYKIFLTCFVSVGFCFGKNLFFSKERCTFALMLRKQ